MTRTRLADRQLPPYTVNEERANMLTHFIGAVFGVIALWICLRLAVQSGDGLVIAGAAVYGASLIFLYSVSAAYHGLKPGMAKKVMQVIDHCTIYFLIAGTYTPAMLGPFRRLYPVLAWSILGIVWALSIFAAVFTAIDHNKYRRLSMICYIGIGWIIIFAIKPTIEAVTLEGFLYLLAGGIAYTIGAVLYSIGKKRHIRYIHSVFHVFVLLGTALQFVTVYSFCL